MAVVTPTSLLGSGQRVANVTVLGASDTLVYNPTKNPLLLLNNVTGGALTLSIVGDSGGAIGLPGHGDVDVSGTPVFSAVGIGESVAIPLNSIGAHLTGVVTLTGADAMEAQLLES